MGQELIQDTKETLLTIADILYQGRVSDGIAAMNRVMPNISLNATGSQNDALQQRLITDALSPILSAMEEEDGTLMADLITYELVEILDLL